MDKKLLNILFIVASLGLLTAGIIFLGISISGENKGTTPLIIALACILLSNLFNVLRLMNNRKK